MREFFNSTAANNKRKNSGTRLTKKMNCSLHSQSVDGLLVACLDRIDSQVITDDTDVRDGKCDFFIEVIFFPL